MERKSGEGKGGHPLPPPQATAQLASLTEFFFLPFHVGDQESRLRQTSDSSWEFLRIENKQTKTVQNSSYG